MSYNPPQFYGPNGSYPPLQGQMQPISGVSVQIPRMSSAVAQQTNNLSVKSDGYYSVVQHSVPPISAHPQIHPTQTQRAQGAVNYAPRAETPVDYPLLLVNLAEEYFDSAFGSAQKGIKRETSMEIYYKLIATGLGCLEAVLKRESRLQPRLEASIRLKYASILYQETENYMQAEQALSQGISLCDRHHFLDLKYNMQHLLAHLMFATNARAALKFLDGIISDVEAYRHIAWIYAFRFLRASLSLKISSPQESLIAINHLKTTANLANRLGDRAISATASTMEAIAHLHRSTSAESIEQAQRALAAARSFQFDPASQQIPQLMSMVQFIDICCSLHVNDPKQGLAKADALQKNLDALFDEPNWTETGLIPISISPTTTKSLHDCGSSAGVIHVNAAGAAKLVLNWLPKDEIYALGFLMNGAVYCHRNSVDGEKSEKFLKEAKGKILGMQEPQHGTLAIVIAEQHWRRTLLCHVEIHLIFAMCNRSAWRAVRHELTQLKDLIASLPPPSSQPFSIFATYIEGLMAQATGNLAGALAIFLSTPFALSSLNSSTPATQQSLAILSALNTILIIRNPTHPSNPLVPKLLTQLESVISSQPSKNIHAAFNLLRAAVYNSSPSAIANPSSSSSQPSIVKTKTYLQNALHGAMQCANNQLITMTLNFMTWKFFQGSIGEQAEKSARSSVSMAKKCRDSMWVSVADGQLAKTLGGRGKGEEAKLVEKEGRELAARLGGGMVRYEDEVLVKSEDEGDTILLASG